MDPKGRGVVLQSCWIVHAGKWFSDVSRGAAGSGAQQCLARHRRGRCASLSEVDLASATKALFGNRLAPRIYGAGKPSSRIFNCSSVSSAPGAAEQSVSEQALSRNSLGAVDAVQVAVKFKFQEAFVLGLQNWSLSRIRRFILGECELVASLSRQFGSSLWMSGGGHGARRYADALRRQNSSFGFLRVIVHHCCHCSFGSWSLLSQTSPPEVYRD